MARPVAPHAGAWIEINMYRYRLAIRCVAPHAGAWIEIDCINHLEILCLTSHPTRVRGLKFTKIKTVDGTGSVAPHAGAWIEIE